MKLPCDLYAEKALQKFKSNKVGKLSAILDSNRYMEHHEQFMNNTTNMFKKGKTTKKPRKNIKDQRMLTVYKKKSSKHNIKKSENIRERLSHNNKSMLIESI